MPRNRLYLLCALLLLGALAWLGITGGVQVLPVASTVGQKVQAFAQLTYGIFSLLTAATALWLRPWARPIRTSWLTAVTVAGGLAPIVWGGSNLVSGLLAGVTAWLIGRLAIWLLALGTRSPASA